MLAFLVIGGVGLALLLVSVLVGDHLDGALDSLGAGDWLSGGALAGFVGAFGFGGALILGATSSLLYAVVGGVLAGVAVGLAAGWLTLKLQRDGDDSTVRSSSLVVAGHLTRLNARCVEPLPAGHGVTVEAVLSPTSVSVLPRFV